MNNDFPCPTHTPNLQYQSLRQRNHVRFSSQANSQASPTSPTSPNQEKQAGRTLRNYLRVKQFQQRWENIKEDLPPQLTRSHIGMISIGGVIGTGLFLGSGAALAHGGPVGALLGYSIIGTLVYCLCVSIGEMIAFLPNVGGVVGLADLFVDRALGFSLGWAAWYNWAVTLPTEVAAATVLTNIWNPIRTHNGHSARSVSQMALSAIFLIVATAINCFPSRVYGESEFWLSTAKVATIVLIILVSLIIDLGASKQGFIGLSKWLKHPFGHNYLQVSNVGLGRFLDFWSVLLQACFSFSGSEVPGIAAGEVIDATRNVPRALRRVWFRITLFYVGGIFCAGLLVDSTDASLLQNEGSTDSSPFVIAFHNAGLPVLRHGINFAIILSAWSAAASDIYIGSRFLFFLARCHHAPRVFASLFRYPRRPIVAISETIDQDEEDAAELDDDDVQDMIQNVLQSDHGRGEALSAENVCIRGSSDICDDFDVNSEEIQVSVISVDEEAEELDADESQPDIESGKRPPSRDFVLPLPAVLASASVGCLSFLSAKGGNAAVTFNWLSAVTSIASLQSWTGMLYTYIRWHKGTLYHEKRARYILNEYATTHDEYERAKQTLNNIERIRKHRHWGQPYLAYYAFVLCIIILCTNGFAVFIGSGWRIANLSQSEGFDASTVPTFLASYVPIPFFILITLGYKMIMQTKMVEVEDMVFYDMHAHSNQEAEEAEEQPLTTRDKILRFLSVI